MFNGQPAVPKLPATLRPLLSDAEAAKIGAQQVQDGEFVGLTILAACDLPAFRGQALRHRAAHKQHVKGFVRWWEAHRQGTEEKSAEPDVPQQPVATEPLPLRARRARLTEPVVRRNIVELGWAWVQSLSWRAGCRWLAC